MNLNGKTINPAEMRVPIEFLARAIVEDSGGARSKSYTVVAPAWAKWTNIHGQAAIQQGGEQVEHIATVLTRYRSDISPVNAVRMDGQIYRIITPIDNIQQRGEYMEFSVRRMEAS